MTELLVLRHGETEWNRAGRFQGALDSGLTDLGRAQAVALGDLLRHLGVTAASHLALASPQGRAAETARLALGPLGLLAEADEALVEIGMGAWSGLHRAEIAQRWPGPPGEGVVAFYGRCEGGETLAEVARRARRVLDRVARHGRPAVLVTHGLTLRVLCALALGWGLDGAEKVEVPQGSLARVAGGRLEVLTPRP